MEGLSEQVSADHDTGLSSTAPHERSRSARAPSYGDPVGVAVGPDIRVVVPVAVFIAMLYLMYAVSMRAADPFHLTLLAGTAAVLIAAVVLSDRGLSLAWSQVVVALAPVVTIVGYEAVGHRHLQDHVSKLRA